jgi:hypothetical protein
MNINITSEDPLVNEFLEIFEVLKKRPNKFLVHDIFLTTEFNQYLTKFDLKGSNFITELINNGESVVTNRKAFHQLQDNLWISYLEVDIDSEESTVGEITFYYDTKESESIIYELLENLQSLEDATDIDLQESKVNYLSQINNSLQIININLENTSVSGYHNKDITKQINKLIKKINKSSKGISVFCGERGLGKTFATKFVCQEVDRISIFIPFNLIDHTINNPEFRNLISSDKKYLLIIDDCEFLYSFGKNNNFSGNILQLIDGFLSDQINLQILLVWNLDQEDIDDNILNSNNILDIIQFEYLDVKVANSLSEDLELKQTFTEPLKLVDVMRGSKLNKNKKIGLE